MEYKLIGKVHKEHYSNKESILFRIRKINFESMNVEQLFNNYKFSYEHEFEERKAKAKNLYFYKFKDIEDYKSCIRLREIKELPSYKEFDHEEDIDYIVNDRDFRDNDIITFKEKDYKVIYKYNQDTKEHELHIDYIIRTIVDEKLKKQCAEKLQQLNNKIKEYNKQVDEMEVKIDETFINFKKEEKNVKEANIKTINNKITLWNSVKEYFKKIRNLMWK